MTAASLPVPRGRNLYLPKQVNQESMHDLTKNIIEINENDEYLKKIYAIHDLAHATPLYHQVSTGFHGKVQDMEESLEETKRLQKKIEDMTCRLTSITKKKLKEILKNKTDWVLTAEEALVLGVIDEII